MSKSLPILKLKHLAMRYDNGVVALRGVDLDIAQGEVHGLLGANGAGKSTLIKILSGAHPATDGLIELKGNQVRITSPNDAKRCGIATVPQHIPLVPTLSVLENVLLGGGSVWRMSPGFRQKYRRLCEQIGYWLDPDELVEGLSIGQRQMVAIMKALATGAEVIVLDEPTASLAQGEREVVYKAVHSLARDHNKAILFVSHFLDEIIALTDCVTILREGQVVLRGLTKNLTEMAIAEAIVGREIVALERRNQERTKDLHADGQVMLEIRNLASEGRLSRTSLMVSPGEVVGVAGLLGSGRSELLHAIFGADRRATGSVLVNGREIGRSTTEGVRAGIALVPEDRARQGLVPNFEIWRNITLPALQGVSWLGQFPLKEKERDRAIRAISDLNIKTESPDALVSELSGGNAQKVTFAKWLFSDVKIFLLDEPTAGIDIGAKTDILRMVRQLGDAGKTIMVVSSEFEELLAICDRIIVMRDGSCVAERMAYETSEHELILLAGGKVVDSTSESVQTL